jgi:hypothetical protein
MTANLKPSDTKPSALNSKTLKPSALNSKARPYTLHPIPGSAEEASAWYTVLSEQCINAQCSMVLLLQRRVGDGGKGGREGGREGGTKPFKL